MVWRKLAIVLLIVLFLPTALTHLVIRQVENRLHFKFHKRPLFYLVPGVIHLPDVSFDWEGQLAIHAGSATIKYPINAPFLRSYIVEIEAKALDVEFGPRLKKAFGEEKVHFDTVNAVLELQPDRGTHLNQGIVI